MSSAFQNLLSEVHSTLPIMKKICRDFLHYRWLFIKGDIFIGEQEIFDAEVFLHYSQFFIKGNFIIDGVECIVLSLLVSSRYRWVPLKPYSG